MAQSKNTYRVAALVVTTLLVLGVWLYAKSVGPGGAEVSATQARYSALPAEATSALGVRLEPLSAADRRAALLSMGRALSIAQSRLGDRSSRTSSVRSSLGEFTDTAGGAVGTSGVTRGHRTPAFIVTFSGLSMPAQGRSRAVNTEDNVVVDAVTGQIIEEFSYR